MTRREKLIASFPENIDAIIVTNEKNQRYLTGFDYTDGYVIVTGDLAETAEGISPLSKYDRVIVRGQNLFDGKVIVYD